VTLGSKLYAAIVGALVLGGVLMIPGAPLDLALLAIPVAAIGLFEWGKSEGRKEERRLHERS
jgi:hypothetical protein